MGFLQNDFRLTVTGKYEVITIDCIFCRNVVFGDWKHILQKKSIHNAIVQATDMQGVTGPTAGQFLIHDSLELFCAATHTVTHTLNASSNAALFAAMKAYFETGNSVLVLYNGETSSSSGYSSNYARVTSCTISVTYIDAVVWYRDGGTWRQCTVWYRLNGAWVQVVPYYNSGGTWVRV